MPKRFVFGPRKGQISIDKTNSPKEVVLANVLLCQFPPFLDSKNAEKGFPVFNAFWGELSL
jgi:hypothetical protein